MAMGDNENTNSQNNLEGIRNIILCEGGQMQKRPYYMVPFIQSIKSGKTELCCE